MNAVAMKSMDSINIDRWDAKKYEESSFLQQYYENKILKDYQFNAHSTILDIGCGDGRMTTQIAQSVPHSKVLGIDSSESMIFRASEKYATYENVKFKIQDALMISEKNVFNYTISFFCLHFVLDQADLLKRIYQALQVNGQVLFILPAAGDDVSLVLGEVFKQPKWQEYVKNFQPHFRLYSDSEYIKLLETANFQVDLVETIHDPVPLPNIDAFRNYIEALPIFQHLFSVEILPQFFDDYIETFLLMCQRKYSSQIMVDLKPQVVKAHKTLAE